MVCEAVFLICLFFFAALGFGVLVRGTLSIALLLCGCFLGLQVPGEPL